MKKILVLSFRQETNTFNPIVAQMSEFNAGGATEGQAVFDGLLEVKSAIHGAVDAFSEFGAQPIPTVFMQAPSGGRVADSALQYLMDQVAVYAQNNEFDAIYASLHGATCTESDGDACGALVEHLRKLAGSKPIAASFDLHANITRRLLRNIDIICGYQTYPHRDLYEAGYRAGKLCMQMLEGKQFCLASAAVPMLLPPAGYTTDDCFSALMAKGHEMVKQGQLLDFTVFPVQPWLDIPEIVSRIVTIAEDAQTAKACADALAGELFALRDEAQPDMLTVDEIIDIAEKNTSGKPVIMSESADSPNGGCVGDSPIVALRLMERGSQLRATEFIRDPEAVQEAFRLGIGGKGTFRMGAAFTPGMPGPLVAEGTVISLHDGYFTLEGPANRGVQGYIGPSAVVRIGNMDILLCTFGSQSGDPQHFRHFGIEPSFYDLVVVKANTSFRLPYGRISQLIYAADTPGAGASNLKLLQWHHLPEGLYPFTQDSTPEKAEIW